MIGRLIDVEETTHNRIFMIHKKRDVQETSVFDID